MYTKVISILERERYRSDFPFWTLYRPFHT